MKKFISILLAVVLSVSMIACSNDTPTSNETTIGSEQSNAAYKTGKYTSSAKGNNGDVKVEVEVDDAKIVSVKILEHSETPGISDSPIKQIPETIVANQTLAVDTVAGATVTSKAILAAVESCLVEAGADINALKNKVDNKEPVKVNDVEKTADVVIVGAGGAGLAAAVSATDKGASVIVIEKMGVAGGNTIVSGGIYNCPDPALQKPEGIEDSPEFYAKQTWEGGDKVGNKELVDVLCFNAYDGLEWLKSIGIKFSDKISQGAGSLYRRTHSSLDKAGTGYIKAYLDNLASKGDKAEIMYNTKGESLIVDNGAVVGVIATGANGEKVTLHANKNVIIATGGFSANVEMRQKYNTSGKWPELGADVLTTNTPGITGDGIKMANDAGADLVDMEQIQMLYLANPKTGAMTKYTPRCLAGTDKIIFVNTSGERFVREDGRRDEICGNLLKQDKGLMYIIESMDGDDAKKLDEMTLADGTPIKEAEANGDVFISDTLEELAGKIGCDPAKLKTTVEEFNKAVDAGKDKFGRELYSVKLITGPFIATPRMAAVHHTMGGIKINKECQALDKDGKVIKGLLAAGEVTGGIHGANRLGGNAIVDTVVFGKLAGEVAAR